MSGPRFVFVGLLLTSFGAYGAEIANESAIRSAQLSDQGDRLFQQARFEEAESAYREAVDLDGRNVQAHLGAGKIAAMLSDRSQAARHYSAAYQLAPLDPNAILGFADMVNDPAAQRTLWRRFLSVSKDWRSEDVRARLAMAAGPGPSIEDAGRSYILPLESAGGGFLLAASVNHGRRVKLLVDTGASGVVLNRSAAAAMRLEYVAEAAIVGFGAEEPAGARMMRAASFDCGELRFFNLPVQVAMTDLIPGADGVVGLDVFGDFLIRLNGRKRSLELVTKAYPNAGASCPHCQPVYRLGHLFLQPVTINGHAEGYFIIDSGSVPTLISRRFLFQDGGESALTGAQGREGVSLPVSPLVLRIGNRPLFEPGYAAFDEAKISRRFGTEIGGVLGVSLLRQFTLVVDYRLGLIDLESTNR